jgi:hypothetical protein
MMKLNRKGAAAALLLLSSLALSGRGQEAPAQARKLPTPAGPASGQPNLAVGRDGAVYLSWIERLPDQKFALKFSRKQGANWSAPRVIAAGQNWFVNWADFPSLVALPDNTLAAHWLVKSGPDTYAYDVRVSRSADGGKS